MKFKILWLSVCINLLLVAAPSFAITLTDKGVGEAVIVVAKGAPEIVPFAAEELQTYIEKISGVKLPIVEIAENDTKTTTSLDGKKLVLVGESTMAKKLGLSAQGFKPDGFQIVTKPDAIIIIGKDDNYAAVKFTPGFDNMTGGVGTLYGVYRFLNELGVRWFFPGEAGEVVPKMERIDIPNLQIKDAPWAVLRRVSVQNGEEKLWARRVGFGGAVNYGANSHSFKQWHESLSFPHPEFFALRTDGSRGTNICWYAPGVREMMVKYAKTIFDRIPANVCPDYMLMENDGAPRHCTCQVCRTKLMPEEGYYGDMSDYAVEAAIEVSNTVKADYPDRMISIGAYNNTVRPPVKDWKLPSNVSIQIAKQSLYMNWTDDGRKTMYNDIIGGWLRLKPAAITFWDYYQFDCWGKDSKWQGIPAVATGIIVQDIKRVKEMTDKSKTPFMGESIFAFDPREPKSKYRYWWICLDLYVNAKLLWNPDVSVKNIMDDFFKNYFGPAAEPMKKFYAIAEDTWAQGGVSLGVNYYGARGMTLDDIAGKRDNWLAQNPWSKLFNPTVIEEMSGYLSEAERLCANSSYKEHLKVVEDGFKFALERSAKYGNIEPLTEDNTEAFTKS